MNKPWFNHSCISEQEVRLSNDMRLVWEQHVYWTRMTINSIAFDLPDLDAVTTRLLRNATDMGNLLKPFYGNRIAAKFGNLIREHLLIAAELVKAAKAGNQKAVADAERRWYANGEEIAKFLSRINPFISRDDFQEMFSSIWHLLQRKHYLYSKTIFNQVLLCLIKLKQKLYKWRTQ